MYITKYLKILTFKSLMYTSFLSDKAVTGDSVYFVVFMRDGATQSVVCVMTLIRILG